MKYVKKYSIDCFLILDEGEVNPELKGELEGRVSRMVNDLQPSFLRYFESVCEGLKKRKGEGS